VVGAVALVAVVVVVVQADHSHRAVPTGLILGLWDVNPASHLRPGGLRPLRPRATAFCLPQHAFESKGEPSCSRRLPSVLHFAQRFTRPEPAGLRSTLVGLPCSCPGPHKRPSRTLSSSHSPRRGLRISKSNGQLGPENEAESARRLRFIGARSSIPTRRFSAPVRRAVAGCEFRCSRCGRSPGSIGAERHVQLLRKETDRRGRLPECISCR